MKKIIILLIMTLIPFKVFAAGGFSVSPTNISIYPGETKTIVITSDNAVGKLNISSTNASVASVNTGSIFIQNPGSSGNITITGKNVGTATISVVASSDFATMDEEILAGKTRTITVTVKDKSVQTTQKTTTKPTTRPTTKPVDNRSKNNNIKELLVEGYELTKIDNNNYSLSVPNNVTSINVVATAEDSKAKVEGTGSHEIVVGENNIEVIVTAENESQNKINIKVVRKDGYYLDDLDVVLNNKEIKETDIIINADSVLNTEQIEKIKNSDKIIKLNYYDENKKLIYSWIINSKELKSNNNLLTSINYTSKYKKEISKLSNYADGLYINFKQEKNLPNGSKIKLFVGDKYEDGESINIYSYNTLDNKLNKQTNLLVSEGYIEFELSDISDYFITMSNIGNNKVENDSTNIFIIVSIIELIIILMLIYLIIKIKTNKQNNVKSSDKKEQINENIKEE